MNSRHTLYRCGDKPWVPLLGIWGAVSYAPLQVRRQYGSKQFIPMTHGLDSVGFSYDEQGCTSKIHELGRCWTYRYLARPGNYTIQLAPQYMVWKLTKIRNIVFPPVDDTAAAINFNPAPPPPTALEIAERDFELKRKEWETRTAVMIEQMDDLRIKLDRKELEIKEISQQRDTSNAMLDDLHQKKGKKRMETESLIRRAKADYEREKEDLREQVDRLLERVHSHEQESQDWHREKASMVRALEQRRETTIPQNVESAYREIQRLRGRIEYEAERYTSLQNISTEELGRAQELLELEKIRTHNLAQRNEQLATNNQQLTNSNQRLTSQNEQLTQHINLESQYLASVEEEARTWKRRTKKESEIIEKSMEEYVNTVRKAESTLRKVKRATEQTPPTEKGMNSLLRLLGKIGEQITGFVSLKQRLTPEEDPREESDGEEEEEIKDSGRLVEIIDLIEESDPEEIEDENEIEEMEEN